MIYLDNGATTFPKPFSVIEAVNRSLRDFSANPGRSGHKLAMRASGEIYKCRKNAADFFNLQGAENVIFTPNCTLALNTVIKGLLKEGDHAVVSCCEHNSVMRPLQKLGSSGVTYTCAEIYANDPDSTVNSFRNAIKKNTSLAVINHCSNVFGFKLPVGRITALCHQYGIPVCIDAAQSAGVMPIDMAQLGADFLAAPGHKGLYGPLGTGLLLINNPSVLPDSLIEGGTGSNSSDLRQPQTLPDFFESGTQNLNGICGLNKGIDFVRSKKPENILRHEMRLTALLYDMLKENKRVILYTDRPSPEHFAPILSFNVKNAGSEEIARILDVKYGIAVRAGLHCAPAAHEFMNTAAEGTVRVCPSVFTKSSDILIAARAINEISLSCG